jgi:hypothetical protein
MNEKMPSGPEILRIVSQLDHFRGIWAGGMAFPIERLARLRQAARIQSVGGSCRIGGIRVSDAEVAAILGGSGVPSAASPELVGYSAAIDRPFPSIDPIVTFDELASLNAVVLGKSGRPPVPSPLRETPLHLEVFDAEGRAVGRVLQTLPPRLLRDKIEQLVSWLEFELRSGEQHPLLVVGAFFVYCTATSPFERANGRTARVMVPHLLRRAGYGFVEYASWERVLDEMRDGYYEAIDTAETKIWTEEADLEPWLLFFLQSVQALVMRLQAAMAVEERARELPPLQRAILETIRVHGSGAASLLIAATGANRNTLKDNLRRLVDRGLLERIGNKRGTIYKLPAGEP